MKLIACFLALLMVSASIVSVRAGDLSYNYNVPLHPLVNYTSGGHAYFFTPDPTYAYLKYPTNSEAIYGNYYSTAKYNTRVGMLPNCD